MENRCYHQHCGLARALDRIGERWTLLIVRDMLLGPRRYTQLLESLKGITTNLLAKRLKDMQAAGLIEKAGSGPQARYRLTSDGAALEPVVMEVARWGGRFMPVSPAPEDRLDLGWALLSCKRRYRVGEQDFRVGLWAGPRTFELIFEPDRLLIQEREAVAPHLLLKAPDQAPFFGLLMQGARHPDLEIVEVQANSLQRLARALTIPLQP